MKCSVAKCMVGEKMKNVALINHHICCNEMSDSFFFFP